MTTILKFKLVFAVVLSFVGSGLNLAQAAVPDTINYQGYLTNASDKPINSTEAITFKIYSVDIGGVELWDQTKSVEIKDGKFSIELGDSLDPFPNNLFDGLLYLGITVGADAEMSPRKPLTSAPFAINAGNAMTLEGETLNNIIYEDVNAVAAMGVKGSGNALNHDRYTNPEAVAAMGATTNLNALNHNRFSDANVVTAIKDAGGPGSEIDSDTVDGQHAADIISAASDEVRTPISSVPYTISTPGSYYFTGNLTHTNTAIDAITVTADDATIDMMGFVLKGPGKSSGSNNSGIDMTGRTNVTVTNGTVREFGSRGIDQHSGTGRGHRVIDVRAISNGSSGIYMEGPDNHVRGCIAQSNGGAGIFSGVNSLIISNSARDNDGTGIWANNGSNITNNTVFDNRGERGIYGGKAATLTNNNAFFNEGNGIEADFDSSLTNNTVSRNSGWGIYGRGSNLIESNTANSNNKNNATNLGGISVNSDSRVVWKCGSRQ